MQSIRTKVLFPLVWLTAACPLLADDPADLDEPHSALDAAARVDALIESALPADVELAPRTSDEDFLRRVTLDLAGTIPSPNDLTLFAFNPDPGKRADVIDRLLDSEGYAANWARYWADVIFLRATDQRSRLTQGVFEEWMRDQLRENRPWDEVATELITATGAAQENGRTALIFAQGGDPAELAAETSRIFLGIQIQCANCHDHPYDEWTREQFHELAAYFPRIQIRRDDPDNQRSFVVASVDNARRRNRDFDPERFFRVLDRNRDGRVVEAEAARVRQIGDRFAQLLAYADANDDDALTLEEFKAIPRPPANQPGRGAPEYYMPDLDDPSSRGDLMEPAFFVDGSSLETGVRDLDRRQALAESMTAKDNFWFSAAFVNRIWAEMTGVGFYMPIDDIGPQRDAQHSETLHYLVDQFAAHDYDVKWLLRTIANTEAYQRQIRTAGSGATHAFAAAAPTRLRADQVYNAVTDILGTQQLGRAARRRAAGIYGSGDPARAAFKQLFGYDPSTPQEDIIGSIPQALFLMNSPQLENLIRGDGNTRLARILRDYPDDRDALGELYLLVLVREPTERELEVAAEYIAGGGDRTEAYEDLMWSLLNSSEFLSKR